jgi:hypothetical protein
MFYNKDKLNRRYKNARYNRTNKKNAIKKINASIILDNGVHVWGCNRAMGTYYFFF